VRWGLVLVLLGAVGPARAGSRTALLIGNDHGLAGEAPLRHTGDDVRRLAGVLRELGQFAPQDIHMLLDGSARAALQALRNLERPAGPSLLLVYYSGHANAEALHMNGTRLPLDTLLDALGPVDGGLQVLLLDACQSGAASRNKGSMPGPAFDVRLVEALPEGNIVITSSAADEQSYESDAHRGALFTTHWIAALRGAADSNGDGRVTVSEAYTYAYAQTLRDTLLSGGGPQHPTFRWGFSGRREPVLTYLEPDAWLTLRSDDEGAYTLFTGDEHDVVTELSLRAGQQARLALASGDYVVKKRDTAALRAVAVHLGHGDDRLLFDRQMREVPFVRLADKGGLGVWRGAAGVGQYAAGLGPRGPVVAALGADVEQASWSYGGRLLLSSGAEERHGLRTDDAFAGVRLHAVYVGDLGPLTWGVGPAFGGLYWRQESHGHPPRASLTGLAGAHGAVTAPVWQSVQVAVTVDLGAQAVRSDDPIPRLGAKLGGLALLPWMAYALEAQLIF
jgi:hypothetical protein